MYKIYVFYRRWWPSQRIYEENSSYMGSSKDQIHRYWQNLQVITHGNKVIFRWCTSTIYYILLFKKKIFLLNEFHPQSSSKSTFLRKTIIYSRNPLNTRLQISIIVRFPPNTTKKKNSDTNSSTQSVELPKLQYKIRKTS